MWTSKPRQYSYTTVDPKSARRPRSSRDPIPLRDSEDEEETRPASKKGAENLKYYIWGATPDEKVSVAVGKGKTTRKCSDVVQAEEEVVSLYGDRMTLQGPSLPPEGWTSATMVAFSTAHSKRCTGP